MSDRENTPRKHWTPPQIIPVGSVDDETGFDPQYNLRDNWGDHNPQYKVGTHTNREVDLPAGE
jgi:hypothetical protein